MSPRRVPLRTGALLFGGGVLLVFAAAAGLAGARIFLASAFATQFPGPHPSDWIPSAGLWLVLAALYGSRTGRPRVTFGAAGGVAALSLLGLADYGLNAGAEPLRLRLPITVLGRWLSAEHMTPLTALVFLVLAGGCMAAAMAKTQRVRSVTLATAGSISIATSLFGAGGEVASLVGSGGFNRLQGLGVGLAAGTLGAGLALAGLAWNLRGTWEGASPRDPEADGPNAAPLIGLVLATFLSLTLLAFQAAQGDREDRIRTKFEAATRNIADDIGDRMPTYALALRGIAEFVEETGGASRVMWHHYIDALQVTTAFPGILGIGYLAYVPGDQVRAHLKTARRNWSPAYRIYPAGVRDAYAPVVLLEPDSERARQVIGFDHLSEATRSVAIRQVRDSGEPAISGNIVLVLDQNRSRSFGFQMYMPVYRNGLPTKTVEQRRAALAGIVFSPFRFDELMRGILLDRYKGVHVRILDGDPAVAAHLVFDGQSPADGTVWSREVPLNLLPMGAFVLGHRWTLVTAPLNEFIAGEPRSSAWVLLGSGTAISMLFAAAIWQLFAIEARARSLAAAQALTQETEHRLRAEQALQAAQKLAQQRVEALNRELVQRAGELELANRELEAFSYSVSHDLKQPVSAIAGFSSMALEDFAQDLHPEVKNILGRIETASFRMSQLIDGLLALSSISRAALRSEPVDLTDLAHEALAELRAAHPERKVEVHVEEGMSAQGDRKLLQVLVNNVLGNAWKYTGKQPRARIDMGVTATAKGPAFFVRDNGAGFDMARTEKLFSAFHRLHSASEFPGTGVGLATVHRIVARHGGQIWAEAAPEQGACFYFTFGPAVQAADHAA